MAVKGAATGAMSKPAPLIDTSKFTLDDLIQPSEEPKRTAILNIGEQGVGKTTTLNTLWPWIEQGAKVLYRNRDMREGVISKRMRDAIDIIELPYSPRNIGEATSKERFIAEKLYDSRGKYDCIIDDSLTPLSNNAWVYVCEEKFQRLLREGKTGLLELDKFDDNYDGNADKYAAQANEVMAAISSAKDNCKLYILIAHEKEPWTFQNGAPGKFTVNARGSVKKLLPSMFGEVYFCYDVPKVGWQWLTRPMGQRFARTEHPLKQFIPMDYSIAAERKWEEHYDEALISKDEPTETASAITKED